MVSSYYATIFFLKERKAVQKPRVMSLEQKDFNYLTSSVNFCKLQFTLGHVSSTSKLVGDWIRYFLSFHQGLPWWFSGKESTCQCRCEFNSWVRNIPWRRKGQPTPVFLPEKSVPGYSPLGRKRVGHDLSTKRQQ